MIYIRKKSEPDQFLQYRQQKYARFNDMDSEVKEQLRKALLREQGHLCAYCMRRIRGANDVKIEHLQARTQENELQYHNLLAVCRGGEDGPVPARSCDTKKANRPLFINPLSEADMKRIYYGNNGEIHSTDMTEYVFTYEDNIGRRHEGRTSPERDLQECLNLNYKNGIPMMGRRTALRKFQQLLHPYKDAKSKKTFLKKMRKIYAEEQEYLEPYIGILRWYIDKKLKQI